MELMCVYQFFFFFEVDTLVQYVVILK